MKLLSFVLSLWAGVSIAAFAVLADTQVPVEDLRIANSKLEFKVKGKWYAGCAVRSLPAGTPLVHWGPSGEIERLLRQGRVDSNEVDHRVRNGSGAEGGGFYVSLSGADSSDYGPRGIAAFPSQPVLTYDVTYVTPSICPSLSPDNAGSYSFTYNGYETPSPLPPDFASPLIPTSQEIKPTITAQQLRGLGFQAIKFTSTWLNIIDAAPLVSLKEVTPELYLDRLFDAWPRLRDLMVFDQWFSLDGRPQLARISPALQAVSQGTDVDDASLDTLFRQLFYVDEKGVDRFPNPVWNPGDRATPLLTQLKRRLHPLFVRAFKQVFANQVALQNGFAVDASLEGAHVAGDLGVRFDEFLPEHRGYSRAIPVSYDPDDYNSIKPLHSKPGWTRDFYFWAWKANLYQVLLAMAEGDGAPWLRDLLPGSNLTWAQIQDLPYVSLTADSEGGYPSQFESAYARIFGGKLPAFRELPETLSDLAVDSHQLSAIQANPLLTISRLAPTPKLDEFRVDLEFPSVRTWRRQAAFLDFQLRSELDAAENKGILVDPTSPECRALTKRMLKNLHRSALGAVGSYRISYLTLLSASPFGHETSLAIVRSQSALLDPVSLLKMRPSEAVEEAYLAGRRVTQIMRAIDYEGYLHPDYPKYFELPGIWRAGLEVQDPGIDEADLVRRGKAFFLRPEIAQLVREHRYEEVRKQVWAAFPIGTNGFHPVD